MLPIPLSNTWDIQTIFWLINRQAQDFQVYIKYQAPSEKQEEVPPFPFPNQKIKSPYNVLLYVNTEQHVYHSRITDVKATLAAQ